MCLEENKSGKVPDLLSFWNNEPMVIGQASSLTEVFNGQLTDNDRRPPC